MLYNGKKNWSVPRHIIRGYDIFKDDIFNYWLVDVNKLDEEKLKGRLDLLSSILYLEKSKRYAEEFVKKLNEVSEYIRGLPQEQLKVFCSWLLRIVRPQVIDQMKNMIDDLLKKIEEEGVDDVGDFIFNVQQLIQEYYKQAEEKGKEKGYEEGIEEGIKQGIEKGSKETLMNIVKNMILAGADDNFIAKVTGLEIEQIKKVRSNLMN